MMILPFGRFIRVRKTVLFAIVIAVFATLIVTTTALARGSGGGGGGGGEHTSSTGECTVCHGSSLKNIHQEAWSTDRTGCYICHPSGRRTLYSELAGASFDCRSCHDLSGVPVDYHMNMDSAHISSEAVCMICHSTGTSGGNPIASLTDVHQGLGEEEHLPITVSCPAAVTDIDDDIYAYCLECHKNLVRIPTLPDNADCTSCHEEEEYNAELNQCFHESIMQALAEAGIDTTAHAGCTACHIKCS